MANRARPNSAYDDPAKVLQEREEKTCAGCIWEFRLMITAPRMVCGMNNQHGKRCGIYEERQG